MKKILITTFLLSIFFFWSFPLHSLFASTPIKILIVPGHDDAVWGAQYGTMKEADMNLALGTQLYNILKKDKRFDVHITRTTYGYTKEFFDYFTTHVADISSFRANAKAATQTEIQNGSLVKQIDGVDHIAVTNNVAQILYGINKWVDDDKMDAVIHVHFNDYPRKTPWTKGSYKGFAIYVPEGQMVNSAVSTDLAKSIFTKLNSKYITSTYPPEAGGIIPDQSLIAMGANGTLLSSVRSVLIEYGYIYRFGNTALRKKDFASMASLTAQGIQNYFFKK